MSRADQQVAQWQARGEDGLLSLRWQRVGKTGKPQSRRADVAVRSSKAVRLTRIKKGYSHPPGKPIFVPGLHGIGLRLSGRSDQQGAPMLAALRWWTSRGPLASYEKDEHCKLLRPVCQGS